MIDRLLFSRKSTLLDALIFCVVFATCTEFYAGGLVGMNEFASPGYPQKYPPSRDCVRVIEAPPGHDILIHFRHVFQIESTYEYSSLKGSSVSNAIHCPNDFIEIRDGRYGFSPLIGRFCGMQIPRGEIRAKSGTIWLRFYSDEVLEYKGFYADYEFVLSESRLRPTSECNIVQNLSLDGYIDSKSLHDFHQIYGNASDSVDCVWRIDVPQSLQVALFVENFTLGAPNMCDANFMEVYSGHTSDLPLRRFCGMSASQTFAMHNTVFVRIYATNSALIGLYTRILFTAYSRLNDSFLDLFTMGFSQLLLIVFTMFIITVILCLWSLTHCSCLRSQRARCDDYLKELSSMPPPGIVPRLTTTNNTTITHNKSNNNEIIRAQDKARPLFDGNRISSGGGRSVWRKRFSRSDSDECTSTNWLTASDLTFPLDRRRSQSSIRVQICD
ncbi:unnamed protein product [Anisakis simplex]|uniref:CUB domain-containing protein n=1 Tax=Anisakis simplex TaxID=6269 RepID=A0A0M3JVV6_ANISI|nr:unnamed protein product [Anisakis simplex]